MIKNNSVKYYPLLDGIRGFAIIIVMLYHCGIGYCKGGCIGVDIFFVLSGFLITSILVAEKDRNGSINFKNFYMRRILRLFPALCLILLFYILLDFILYRPFEHIREGIAALFYCLNWCLAFNHNLFVDKQHIDAGHLWSLSIEEQYYFFWPILLGIILNLKKGKNIALVISFILLCFSVGLRNYLVMEHASIPRLYFGSDTRFDNLILGSLAAIYCSTYYTHSGNNLKWFPYLGWIGILILIVIGNEEAGSSLYTYGFTLIGILSLTIIIPAVYQQEKSLSNTFLDIPLLKWTGTLSYSLYLWHYPIIKILRISHIDFLWGWRFYIAAIVLSFVAASFSYYAVEKPFLSIKNKRIYNPKQVTN